MAVRLGPQAGRVYSRLRDHIICGELSAGSRLASQATMAHEFGVALLTIRQALAALEHDGLVRSEQGRGTFVSAEHPRVDLPGSEETFRPMVEAAPLPIVCLDAAGKVKVWNHACESLFGWIEEEARGQRLPCVPEQEWERFYNLHLRAVQGESLTNLDWTFCSRNGVALEVAISIAPMLDGSGYVLGTMLMALDVTKQKGVDRALRQSEERYRRLIELSPDAIILIDLSGQTLVANQQAALMFGHDSPDELIGRNSLDRIAQEDQERALSKLPDTVAQGGVHNVEYTLLRKDGTRFLADISSLLVSDGSGGPMGFLGVIRDISERKRAEQELAESEERFRAVFDTLPDGVSLLALDGTVMMTNLRTAEMFGFDDPDVMIGVNRIDLVSSAERSRARDTLQEMLDIGFVRDREFTMVRRDGTEFPAEWSGSVLRDHGGAIMAIVSVTRDISDRKRAEDALQHQSLHDVLTDLPNRTLLQDRLRQAILSSRRENTPFALLLMDLNRFKEVNDTFGHHTGDLLLQEVGTRLRGALRETDTVARLGGDEFAVLLPGSSAASTVGVVRKILKVLELPYLLEGRQIGIETSIGASFYPEHGDDASTLLRKADIAMYVAKRSNDGYAVYSPKHEDNNAGGLVLMAELRHAIDHDQLVLHYQPKVNFKSGDAHHVEALVRWLHPERGFVLPGDFIPLAERSGLIRPLTWWVLEEALRQWRSWHDAGLEVGVAVNLSAWCLQDEQFAEAVSDLLRTWDAKPSALRLEITESTLMVDPTRAMTILTDLHRLGVKISIDDFGTGYSSLAHLKRLPVDEIKIDKSFVIDMADDQSDAVIVRSVVDLGHNLSLQVVAEGVEDQRTLDMLQTMGCDLGQGYFFSRPSNPDEVERFLRRDRRGEHGLWKRLAG